MRFTSRRTFLTSALASAASLAGGQLLRATAGDDPIDPTDSAPFTPNTLKDAQELRLQVENVQREGIAFDDCEFNPEVRCMAAPVRDFRGRVVGAIGFSGPVWRMSLTGMAEYISVTRSIAAEVSDRFGFRPASVPAPEAGKTRKKEKRHAGR